MRRHITRSTALLSLACLLILLVATAPASQAVPHARIEGSGSSWAANAVNQWIADVTSSGLQVVFTSQGSAQGRKDFANNTTDYAVSDIGFRGVDPATGDQDTNNGRPYAYLPIVAGGTSFPLQPVVRGQAGPRPAAVRPDPRQDLHQPDHQLGRPGHHRRQQRPQAAVDCRSCPWCTPRGRARPRS